jgi:signal transduction histidine kinase
MNPAEASAPAAPPPRPSLEALRSAGSKGRAGFLAYARWLDSISWKRFALLAALALLVCLILQDLPPFNIPWGSDRTEVKASVSTSSHRKDSAPIQIEGIQGSDGRRYEIRVDGQGVQVRPMPRSTTTPATPGAPSTPAPPADPTAHEIATALSEAREALAEAGILKLDEGESHAETRYITAFRLSEVLWQATLLAIVLSFGIKIMAKGRFRAEAQAEQAVEVAEAETLKRQLVEARMAAMQAQVEPHFLFNTLASIDHLIETDPPRASTMQKNLIALLRASMPTLREGNVSGVRDLGREADVIRPYLEILKVRMEDRLQASIDIPNGLRSAEFPPMMIQGLVENAIKHGLEPKPEGGRLEVSAQVVHGQLVVRVADTGVGFGRADTSGTGTGLANLRERLSLIYGAQASLEVQDNTPIGTVVTITLPYRSLTAAMRGN